MMDRIETDVLVIGGWGCGIQGCYRSGCGEARVTLGVKGRYGFMDIRGGGVSDRSAIGRLDYAYFSYIDRLDQHGWQEIRGRLVLLLCGRQVWELQKPKVD